MNKLENVINAVSDLYAQKNPAIDWNTWVFEGHIKIVSDWVEKISEKQTFEKDSVMAAAYLHDLAYAWTSKSDPELDEKSETKAKEVLGECGYSEEETAFIVDQIIHGHGMHDGQKPSLIEAQVLATADALAHFTTDFYIVICWNHYLFENKPLEDYKKWVLAKIERDLHNKIMFEEYKKIATPYYESLKTFFKI